MKTTTGKTGSDLARAIDAARKSYFSPGSLPYRLQLFLDWIDGGGCRIRDETGRDVAFRLNRIQKRLWLEMVDQAADTGRVRLRVGKGRRGGTSTFVRCLSSFLCWERAGHQTYTIAHRDETVDALQLISQRAMRAMPTGGEFLATIHRYGNGSFERFGTSGGQAVGAGDTLSILHWSERAKWGQKKDDTARDTAIAAEWAEIIIDESTFKGRDAFWDDFERARAGLTTYRAVFIAWFEDDRCAIRDPGAIVRTDDEKQLAKRARAQGVELTDGQLAWRRVKILEYGDATFRQEYPSTPDEAVAAGKGLVFKNARDWIAGDAPFEYYSVPWSCRVGGIDFGFADPTVIWSGVWWDGTLWLLQSWRGVETLAADQVEGLLNGHRYFCDPANLSNRKQLEQAASDAGLSCKFLPAPRGEKRVRDFERSELERVLTLADQGRIRVYPEAATQLMAECDDLVWGPNARPLMRRSEYTGHYDSIMAMIYCAVGCLAMGQPRPPRVRETSRTSRRSQFAAY